jgi:2-oxoglutarate ferredoxin oxidoreductase subunit delta
MSDKKFRVIEFRDKGLTWGTYPDLCKSCGFCILKCPVGALSYDRDNIEYLGMPAVKCDANKCIACGTCENICPECAIKVTGKK